MIDFADFNLPTLVDILKEYIAARSKIHYRGASNPERLTQLSEQISRVRAAIKLKTL